MSESMRRPRKRQRFRLRQALSLALQWDKLDRLPKIGWVKGERQREGVLRDMEAERYLAACPQP